MASKKGQHFSGKKGERRLSREKRLNAHRSRHRSDEVRRDLEEVALLGWLVQAGEVLGTEIPHSQMMRANFEDDKEGGRMETLGEKGKK